MSLVVMANPKRWPLLVSYLLVFLRAHFSEGACLPANLRIDCFPDRGLTPGKCEERGCCYEATKIDQPNVPACSYPEDYGGYQTVNITSSNSGVTAFVERSFPSAFPDDAPLLKAEAFFLTESILRIKISDPASARYEAPYPKISLFNSTSAPSKYRVVFDQARTGFRVSRDSGEDIFNSLNVGAFTFADQFLEITTLLADSAHLYGIGEHRSSNLSHKLDWKRFTLFNRDIPPGENRNLYGSHPFYIASDASGKFYGVFLHNSNAMDILLTPRPALTFRTIGGILDFYFFLGPTPEDVVRQYTSVVGRTLLPPLWSLGFHLCRYGYGSLENTRAVYQRNKDAGILYDTQWNDIDYMQDNNIFTINNETFGDLPAFVDELHDAGMQYIVIIDPGVSGSEPPGTYPPFDLAVENDILVKNKSGDVLLGRVWNTQSTAWPDFTNPKSQDYWNQLVADFYRRIPIDGIWIDMNEPSNLNAEGSLDGCPDDRLETPPYTPGILGDKLYAVTLCMTGQHYAGPHYDVHNIYGIAEAHVSNEALRYIGKRPFVISRGSYSGSGRYTGHWSGDNSATWNDLARSVQELLTFNMYGVSLMGADICGFGSDTNQELCNRWYQLGGFYTFARNHNGAGKDQDPAVFDADTQFSIRYTMAKRQKLYTYLYTLFYLSHTTGSTIAKPLFFVYPDDPEAYNEENAFFWGSDVLVVPITEPDVMSVEAYIPPGTWYNWDNPAKSVVHSKGERMVLEASYFYIPTLYRAGSIFFEMLTELSYRERVPVEVLVMADSEGKASTEIYWDDWDSIDPIENDIYGLVACNLYPNNTLTTLVKHWTVRSTKIPVPDIVQFIVYGVDTTKISGFRLNGQNFTKYSLSTDGPLETRYFTLSTDLPINKDIVVEWF